MTKTKSKNIRHEAVTLQYSTAHEGVIHVLHNIHITFNIHVTIDTAFHLYSFCIRRRTKLYILFYLFL
ncbi:MAG: hypothetical protein ACI8RD_014527 [Bacillariaceae sp.]|jgi:hypothetical protein